MKPLTQRQKEIYNKIEGFVLGRGYFPTLREIAFLIGTKNISTAQYFVDSLEEKGWLRKEPFRRSGATLTAIKERPKHELV